MNTGTTPAILKIPNPLECTIVRRINRFVIEIKRERKLNRAHTNNTGRLEQLLVPGKIAFCLPNEKPGKTDYRLFAIMEDSQGTLVDTQLQMRAFERAMEMRIIPWLDGYHVVRRNALLGTSLIDYLLKNGGENAYLEVKSAVLKDGNYAAYPDCPSARGRRHVAELTDYVKQGGQAILLFIAALPGVTAFRPYRAGDHEMCELLAKAKQAGVQMRAIHMVYTPADNSIRLLNADLPAEI